MQRKPEKRRFQVQKHNLEIVDKSETEGRTHLLHTLRSFPKSAIEKILLVDRLSKVHKRASNTENTPQFLKSLLEVLGINYEVSDGDLLKIPKEGPVIVVSNHPFGGIDGIILSSMLLSARSDVKVMANYLLGRIPELRDLFIFVDPFGRADSVRANIAPMRQVLSWLRQGGMACVFPSGEVSHMQFTKRGVTDPKWTDMIARIIRRTGASVLPVHFTGSNSMLFQVAGLLHPRLRTIMLPREMLNKSKKEVLLKVGNLIPFDRIDKFRSDKEIMEYLRMRTYLLCPPRQGFLRKNVSKRRKAGTNEYQSIIDPVPRDCLLKDLESLPSGQRLLDTDRFAVFQAEARQIPNIIREIGRLREITFRQEGEGTGKELDLDRFDSYYLHVFLWSLERQEIAGAYRMGLTDRILAEYGKNGLYTHSLFHYRKRFLAQSDPAIELGRSFIRPEYQRSYHPLMLLWKGIAGYVALNPRYRVLFGPVSITNDYRSVSRQLIVEFLRVHNREKELARHVKARSPLKRRKIKGREIRTALNMPLNIQGLSDLISEIEEDKKGIPILLKHYVRLGGKILEFNIDHNFSDVLDALIFVDLIETDKRLLSRYMGKEGTEEFHKYHSEKCLAECA